jgi:hypothetical protein
LRSSVRGGASGTAGSVGLERPWACAWQLIRSRCRFSRAMSGQQRRLWSIGRSPPTARPSALGSSCMLWNSHPKQRMAGRTLNRPMLARLPLTSRTILIPALLARRCRRWHRAAGRWRAPSHPTALAAHLRWTVLGQSLRCLPCSRTGLVTDYAELLVRRRRTSSPNALAA